MDDLLYDDRVSYQYDWEFPNFLFFRRQHRLTKISCCLFLLRHFCLCNVVECRYTRSRNLERIALTNTSDFYELVMNGLYVDKTLMITALHGVPQRYAVPSGWGKTTNLNMVKRFLEIETDEDGHPLPADRRVNYKLFAGGRINLGSGKQKKLKPLKIASTEYMKLQGKHPVIYTSFKNLVGHNYTAIELEMKRSIANLFRRHRYLAKNGELEGRDKDRFDSYCAGEMDEKDIRVSLEYLSELLRRHFGEKVYVLIDDYDIPAIDLLRRIHMTANESNELLQVVALLARIASSNISPYNNASGCELLLAAGMSTMRMFENDKLYDRFESVDNFADYHGFTEHEVDRLLRELNFKTDRTAVRSWYGFDFPNETRYNPRSIKHFLANKGEFDDYWTFCNHSAFVDFVLFHDETHDMIRRLYHGKNDYEYLFGLQRNYYAIGFSKIVYDLRAVFFAGYLNGEFTNPELFNDLSTGNRNILKDNTVAWICDKLNVTKDVFSEMALQLAAFEMKIFEKQLRNLITGGPGCIRPFVYYGCIMHSLIYFLGSDYVVKSRVPAAEATQLILIPRRDKRWKAVIILGYKVTYDTEELQNQVGTLFREINEKLSFVDSSIMMSSYVRTKCLLKISLIFRGKELALKYQIETYSQ